MADEIRVNAMLELVHGNLQHIGRPAAFTADMIGYTGPTPGSVQVSKYGTNINLSQLVYPGGMCQITNVSPTVDDEGEALYDEEIYVIYGVYDQDSGVASFRPLGEVWPGETYVIRLSRMIGQEIGTGSGTATIESSGLQLRFKAVGVAQTVKVEAFDK